MGSVVLYMSMSVDGFIAGPNDDVDNSLGREGERLHDWLSDGETAGGTAESFTPPGRSAAVLDELLATGAVVAGRRSYDLVQGWAATTMVCRSSC
jgi:dihydrofolate reductase